MAERTVLTGPVRHRLEMMVTYSDTDTGVVAFTAWPHWIERLHTQWWFTHGIRMDTITRDLGTACSVRAMTLEYLAPARVYDRVRQELTTERLGSTSHTVGLRFTRVDDNTPILVGTQTWAYFDSATRAASEVPRAIRDLFA